MHFALLSMVNLGNSKINFRLGPLSVIRNKYQCTIVNVNANDRSPSVSTDDSLVPYQFD